LPSIFCVEGRFCFGAVDIVCYSKKSLLKTVMKSSSLEKSLRLQRPCQRRRCPFRARLHELKIRYLYISEITIELKKKLLANIQINELFVGLNASIDKGQWETQLLFLIIF
jgi:hypothetical protein